MYNFSVLPESIVVYCIENCLYFVVGAFIFSGLCVIGSSTFAAGALLEGTKYMLPLMLLGRLIFGSGNGSLTSKLSKRVILCLKTKCNQKLECLLILQSWFKMFVFIFVLSCSKPNHLILVQG